MIFFRDSQLIVGFFLIETIMINTLVTRAKSERPYIWVQTISTLATRNGIGEFLLTPMVSKIEDATDLVESVKAHSSDEIIWLTFCKLIDRMLFLAFLTIYFFMVVSLLPEGYLTSKYDPIENLS